MEFYIVRSFPVVNSSHPVSSEEASDEEDWVDVSSEDEPELGSEEYSNPSQSDQEVNPLEETKPRKKFKGTYVEDVMLDNLFRRCQEDGCIQPFTNIRKTNHGGTLRIVTNCGKHKKTWLSSKVVNETKSKYLSHFDILWSATSNLTSIGAKTIVMLFDLIGIRHCAKSTVHKVLQPTLNEVLQEQFEKSADVALDEALELGDPLIFSGDSQHDSRRGATYATYPINCRNNNKIIAIEVITKSMTGASSKMETLCAENCLDRSRVLQRRCC